jgi:hypothetical protein
MDAPIVENDAPITTSWYSLDEENTEEDAMWLLNKNDYNDKKNYEKVIYYPTYSVVSKKIVGTEYEFSTGNVYIVFREYGEKKPATIRIDLMEWSDFQNKILKIQQFIHAVEGRNGRQPETVLDIKSPKIYKGWKQHTINIPSGLDTSTNSILNICLKWNEASNGCMIQISRGQETKSANGFFTYIKSTPENTITLGGRGFDYFSRFVVNKLRNAVRMWTNMRTIGYNTWSGIFLDNPPIETNWPTHSSIFTTSVEEDEENTP